MATGLPALLDDVAAIAKLAATSLDDVAAQTAKAGAKAAGVVVDDAGSAPAASFSCRLTKALRTQVVASDLHGRAYPSRVPIHARQHKPSIATMHRGKNLAAQ